MSSDTAADAPGGSIWRGWRSSLATHRYALPVCLALILLLAAVFRFTGLNWDDQTHLHPDERHIWMVELSLSLPRSLGEYLDSATSPLNPYNQGHSFVYGTLPLFLTKWLGELLRMGGGEHIHILGRVLAAFSDLATVLLMFLIGRRLYGSRVGILAAFLSACLVFNIQQAHFFTVDSFTATFVALTFYAALRVADRGRWSDFLFMGVSYGLAVGCKVNVATVGMVMALACLLLVLRTLRAPIALPGPRASKSEAILKWDKVIAGVRIGLEVESSGRPARPISPGEPPAQRHWLDIGAGVAFRLALSLLLSFLVFRIVQPYTFQGPGFFDLKLSTQWMNDMRWVSQLMSGAADYPPSHQWASRAPVLFSLQNMVLWMVGLPLGLASWAGWALAWYQLWKEHKLQHLLILVWTTFFFFYYSVQFVKSSRYFVPFYPFMAVLGAYLLVWAWDRAKAARARWPRYASAALLVTVALGTFLWAFAFTRIYTRPLTRVAASLWVYDNIPPGSTIGWEEWDDIIPWGGVGGRNGYAEGVYSDVKFQPYHEDVPEKLEWFVGWLNDADYIILSSNRLYGSIPRLPMRYPMTTRYYEHLFSGELGFKLLKTFTSRPNLGSLEFADDDADECFTVYDHPKVLVFEKTDAFSAGRARTLLGDGIDWDNIVRLRPVEVPNYRNGLQMTDEEVSVQRSGGTWSVIFNRNSLSNLAPVLIWLLLVEVLGVVTLPMADVAFSGLADRGYILSKTLGILLLVWVTWMAVSLGLAEFGRATIGASLVMLTLCSALLFWRRHDQMRSFWRERRHVIVANEILFIGFFLLFLLVRYGNADLWHPVMGGEKPMDLAYLNAVVRSSTFPPYDPWFAGGYLNYYYFGQIIVGTLIKFTGVVPWVAYNLGIPLLAALTGMGAFCAVYNLTAPREERQRSWKQPAVLWGILGALLVAVLGNLAEIGVWLKPLYDLGSVEAKSSLPLLTGLVRVLSGLGRWIAGQAAPGMRPEWPYWNPSRVMPNGEINEFPFFTFLYADLHAHLIALPFTLLALGLAIAVVRGAPRRHLQRGAQGTNERKEGGVGTDLGALAAGGGPWSRAVSRLLAWVDWGEALLLVALGLAVGALRPINSWDYPTYLLIALVALALREYERHDGVSIAAVGAVLWRSALVLGLSYLLFWPFLSSFGTAYGSFERWRGPRTGLGAYLAIHGLFLWALVPWLGHELFGRRSDGAPRKGPGCARVLRLAARHWDRLPRALVLYRTLVRRGREYDVLAWAGAGAGLLLAAWLAKSREWFYLFILVLVFGTALVVLRRRMDVGERFVWLLFGIGLALSLCVDLIVLKGDIGRMNTVFKFYLQIWVMWSVAAVVGVSHLLARMEQWTVHRRRLWSGVLAALLFLAALYPVLATRAKVNDRFDTGVGATLDGMAYMKRSVYYDNGPIELRWDYDAINWLLDNVQGSPVIAEANTEPWLYRWGSRVSVYTGLPTILGWSWHQKQQRSATPGEWIERRVSDIRRLYTETSTDATLQILSKYNVRYIYLGEVERQYYSGPGLDKFEAMRAQGLLELAYHNEQVRIYEVTAQ